jgi:signal transduction histidine kinase
MDTPQTTAAARQAGPDWDRLWERALVILPWPLLVVPAVISLANPEQTGAGRVIILGLVAAAAVWVYFGHTRLNPERRNQTGPMLVYFIGLLALAVALMTQDLLFLLFAITGFFHAFQLNPWPLGVGGIFATSVVINTMTMTPDLTSAGMVSIYLGVILIQTVAIGSGRVLGEKQAKQHEQRRQLVAKLAATLEENAGLHAQLVTQAREAGVLDERQRIAGEIHDTLAQGLAGIITQVQAAQQVWHLPEQARSHVDRALSLARESLAEARRSVQALRPSQLTDTSLPDALDSLSRRWAQDTGVELRFEVTGDRVSLSPAIEETLFRVAQEALTNVAKHADAGRVGLTLSYLHDVVLLDVRDDGAGIRGRPEDGNGFGLQSMRQRVRSVGGALEIETAPNEGTTINVRVPAIVAAPATSALAAPTEAA